MPVFPPKKWFGNKKEAFISERKKNLNNYFERLVRVTGLADSDTFKAFVNSKDRQPVQ